ncbi:MAG: glycosyltransferase [Hyphomicrobiaceae bacterium]
MRQPSPLTGVRKVAFIAHSARSLLRFRGALVRAVAAQRHRVLVLAPDFDVPTKDALAKDGIAAETFPLEAPGAGPFAERRTERAIAEHLKAFAPHVVVSSGARTAALGALTGMATGATRVVLIINGLSALGLDGDETAGWLREGSARRQRKAALAAAHLVVFHNPDDPRRLIDEELMPATKPYIVTAGSGVDLQHFAATPLPQLGDGLVFLMLAPLDRAQGVLTFAEAAALVRTKSPGSKFQIAGPEGRQRGGLNSQHLARFKDQVEYLGFVADVRPLIGAAHVVVHASISEGMPGPLLEALAMGRPVIACDIPGSRQTVDERVNGVLVPPGDAAALAVAMESFLKRPDLIAAMSRAGRAKAERMFDEQAVVAQMLAALELG